MDPESDATPVIHLSTAEDDCSTNWDSVFSNELIMENILRQLQDSNKDLKNCRLVRKESWNSLATRRLQIKNWEERKFLKFDSPEQIQKYCDTYKTLSDDGENEASRLPFVLFSCYRISLETLDEYPCYQVESNLLALDRMFKTFPHTVKCLDLKIGDITPQLLNSILKSQSSSLYRLTIFGTKSTSSILPANTNSMLMEDNYSLSQLKYLDLRGIIDFPSSSCELSILDIICSKILPGNSIEICLNPWNAAIREAIAVFETYHLINSLLRIEINQLRCGDWQKLAQSSVQLEVLHLSWITGSTSNIPPTTSDVTQFLQSQKNTLKELTWHSSEEFDFPPHMLNLKKLTLVCIKDFSNNQDENPPEAAIPPVQNTPILYGQRFPNLESLVLNSYFYLQEQPLTDFHSRFLVPQFPCTHLRSLELLYDRINADTINRVSEIFPRLESFRISYNLGVVTDDQIFYSALWSASFGDTLKELEIWLDENKDDRTWEPFHLDSIFAGLSVNEVQQRLALGMNEMQGTNCQIESSSILQFSNLKSITIISDLPKIPPGRGFTDFSAFALFGQLKNLKYLYLDTVVDDFTDVATKYSEVKRGVLIPKKNFWS